MSGVQRQAAWAAGAGALAFVLFAPERALATLLPLLILACPVLMVFMLRGTPGAQGGLGENAPRARASSSSRRTGT